MVSTLFLASVRTAMLPVQYSWISCKLSQIFIDSCKVFIAKRWFHHYFHLFLIGFNIQFTDRPFGKLEHFESIWYSIVHFCDHSFDLVL